MLKPLTNPELIIDRMNEILEDSRFWYQPATVSENAPLALIQLSMETEIRALCWVLGWSMSNAKHVFKTNGKLSYGLLPEKE